MSRKMMDLVGQKFGRWTVIQYMDKNIYKQKQYLCLCTCGTYRIVREYSLTSGHSKSCGCLLKDIQRIKNIVHGYYGTSIYQCWQNMLQRCYNNTHQNYKNYGGRGIKVCPEWQEPNGQGFLNFRRDMGERPAEKSLDRIDNDGDYCKNNCKWSSGKEQQRNIRTNNIININNDSKCLTEWCEQLQLSYNTVQKRIQRGWSIKEALEIEPGKTKRK